MDGKFLKRFQILREVPQTSGVYFVYEGEKLIYIGKASNLRRRLRNHLKGPLRVSALRRKIKRYRKIDLEAQITEFISRLRFSFKEFQCSEKELLEHEASYIERMMPELNGRKMFQSRNLSI